LSSAVYHSKGGGSNADVETETIAERVAENQDAFRQANERIETAADEIARDVEFFPFICECPDRSCVETAKLNRHEYEDVRAKGNRFFVAPGHEVLNVEGVTIARVAQKFERYTIMEKVGEAGERAKELDPRSG
jgi:hypothetical protein